MAINIVLIVICIVLAVYIVLLRGQVRRINSILVKRINRKTSEIVSVELINSSITDLASNINECLKVEEKLRLKVVTEEENFKDMIANISHDIRTPLTAIKGYLQLIEKSNLNREQLEKLEVAIKHTKELGRLIDNFFEYTYLYDSNSKVELVKINLTNQVMECFAQAFFMLEERNLSIDISDKMEYVMADKETLSRIIQNLIRNCTSYAKSEIKVHFSYEDNKVVMHFINDVYEDNQINVDRLFDRFYVSDKSRKTTGLGLSIVKLLVEKINGETAATFFDQHIDIMIKLIKA